MVLNSNVVQTSFEAAGMGSVKKYIVLDGKAAPLYGRSGSSTFNLVAMRVEPASIVNCWNAPQNGYHEIKEGTYKGLYIPATYIKEYKTSYDVGTKTPTGTEEKKVNESLKKNTSNSTPTNPSLETKVDIPQEDGTPYEVPVKEYPPVEDKDSFLNKIIKGEGTIIDEVSEQISKYYNTFGSPYVFLDSTDICYYAKSSPNVPRIGRSQLNTIYSNPSVFSICPGKAVYMPGVKKDDQETVMQRITKSIGREVNELISEEDDLGGEGPLAEQLYDFECDYDDYSNRLNVTARVAAIMLGIGNELVPGTKIEYKRFDWSYYTTSKRNSQHAADGNYKGIIDTMFWQFATGIKSTFNDDQYIHFFLTNEGTSMSEGYTITTMESPLADVLNQDKLRNTVKSVNFLFGGAMNQDKGVIANLESDLDTLMDEIGDNSGTIVGSLATVLRGYMKGGKMVVPDMIDDVLYEQTTSCTLYFKSLSADPQDVFLRVILPTLAILNFAWPKQLSKNMYGYPYIVKSYQRGVYNSDLAVISNVRVERGGSDDINWSEAGLATEIKVTFDIVPLHSSLMGGNGRNPFLFMENGPLLEYLGNLCGIDLNVSQINLKLDLITQLMGDYLRDTPTTVGRKIAGSIKAKINNIFSFN